MSAVNRADHSRYVTVELSNKKSTVIFAPDPIAKCIIASDLFTRLIEISTLPTVGKKIYVYPDAVEKQFGFPSGVMVVTEGENPYIYPAATPDVADAFLVAALNVSIEQVTASAAGELLSELETTLVKTEALCEVQARDYNAWESRRAPVYSCRLAGMSTRAWCAAQQSVGVAYGHFVEIRFVKAVENSWRVGLFDGQIIIIVHMGAGPIADYLTFDLGEEMAERNIRIGDIPGHLLQRGYYGAPLYSELGRRYQNVYECGLQYAFYNRLVVMNKIKIAITKVLGITGQLPVILSHKVHSGIEWDLESSAVTQFRGVQRLSQKSRMERQNGVTKSELTFIAGGIAGTSYLVTKGVKAAILGERCCHGVPEWDIAHDHAKEDREVKGVATNVVSDPAMRRRDDCNRMAIMEWLVGSETISVVAVLEPLISFHYRNTMA
jgi:hypothetical protein